MSWLELEAKVAVVTGAAGGIGAATAAELARNGARVAVLDLDVEGAILTAQGLEEAGLDAFGMAVDTTDTASVEAALDAVLTRWGTVDVLVNNAGVGGSSPLADVGIEEWDHVLDVNVTGYLRCAQAFGRVMRERGVGSIVHVASVCGHEPLPGSGSYSPSKAAVLMLSRSLALEWGPSGVRSNCVSPGMTRTPLTEAVYQVPGVLERRGTLAPLQRIATSQDMADACAWLASHRSAYVTGQDITVDGGLSQTVMVQTTVR